MYHEPIHRPYLNTSCNSCTSCLLHHVPPALSRQSPKPRWQGHHLACLATCARLPSLQQRAHSPSPLLRSAAYVHTNQVMAMGLHQCLACNTTKQAAQGDAARKHPAANNIIECIGSCALPTGILVDAICIFPNNPCIKQHLSTPSTALRGRARAGVAAARAQCKALKQPLQPRPQGRLGARTQRLQHAAPAARYAGSPGLQAADVTQPGTHDTLQADTSRCNHTHAPPQPHHCQPLLPLHRQPAHSQAQASAPLPVSAL
jgi:hypothetical protein